VGTLAEATPSWGYGKVLYCHSIEAKTITRRPEENRCGNSSKMGTSKGTTDEEGFIGQLKLTKIPLNQVKEMRRFRSAAALKCREC
jgi:hypothetical protein